MYRFKLSPIVMKQSSDIHFRTPVGKKKPKLFALSQIDNGFHHSFTFATIPF